MRWSEISRAVVAEVIAEYKGDDVRELRRRLREAYPFGRREHWPYKAWLNAVRDGMARWSAAKDRRPVEGGLFS